MRILDTLFFLSNFNLRFRNGSFRWKQLSYYTQSYKYVVWFWWTVRR